MADRASRRAVGHEEGKGIEYEDQEIEADAGVLGEDHHREDQSDTARGDHQQEVPAPEDPLLSPLDGPDDQREHEQSKGQGHGGEREGGSSLVSHYADHLTGLSDKGLAAIGGTGKVGAQVVGEKLLLGLGGGTVGLDTEKDVFAGLRPRGLCVPLMDHPAKGVVASGARGGIAHLAMEMADEQVAGTGGAVVVEVVVAIDNVLGPHIDLQGAENGFLVGIVEVENLLANGALLIFILGAKELKGHNAQLVVGEAKDKAQDEIGRVGSEDAIVDGYIHPTPLLVVPADGGVAILRPGLRAGFTGQQTHLYGVHRMTRSGKQRQQHAEDGYIEPSQTKLDFNLLCKGNKKI